MGRIFLVYCYHFLSSNFPISLSLSLSNAYTPLIYFILFLLFLLPLSLSLSFFLSYAQIHRDRERERERERLKHIENPKRKLVFNWWLAVVLNFEQKLHHAMLISIFSERTIKKILIQKSLQILGKLLV